MNPSLRFEEKQSSRRGRLSWLVAGCVVERRTDGGITSRSTCDVEIRQHNQNQKSTRSEKRNLAANLAINYHTILRVSPTTYISPAKAKAFANARRACKARLVARDETPRVIQTEGPQLKRRDEEASCAKRGKPFI